MPFQSKKEEFNYELELEQGVNQYIDQFGDAPISDTVRATGMQ